MEFENTQFLEAAAETTSATAAAASATTTTIAKDLTVTEHMQSGSGRLMSNGNEMTTVGSQTATNAATLENKQNPPKMQKQAMSADERNATKRSLVILAAIFITSLFAMAYVYMIFPELDESEKQHIKIPRDIQDAKMLAKVLDRYKDMYYFEVMFGVVTAYVFLQTFAIPGSLFLSILLGFLYKFPIALFLICFCSSLGATLCYSLSNLVGRRLIRHFWPKKTSEWSKHVEKHRDSLLNYMLFLRMTPILPNWFINLASPVIGVPVYTFALGTFFGVAPPSIVAIQAGKTLQKMTSSSEAFSWTSMGLLSICALVSLLPGLLKEKLKKKIE
ncbi:transmembrane protein 41 homolog [Anastrepha obliqua]|uniref:transmembrane protein 41 homolog n=1 Tax=Anastrepha ludens TaxID=28586 RepID=UPI0023AF3CD7|nr:transmembrane protein 41 homolog [Anastrepha ludens]XP_053948702.1 transmembrane protein 41 homolog [Anastrepha ludens]XP_054728345.1 transmembrane protein 41 homolog [Anastrepha obliqua]